MIGSIAMTAKVSEIIFLARRFPPSVGGMERFAFELSQALRAKKTLSMITWGGSNKWLPIVLPWFFLKASLKLLINRRIGVIHMQDAVQAPIGWLLAKLFRKPYVVVAHGLDITFGKAFYQTLVIPFVRRADAVISISSATNDEVLRRGIDPSRTHIVTLGTNDDFAGNLRSDRAELSALAHLDLSDRFLLLTTGRLVKRKGVEWFIRNALPEIVRDNPKTLYLIAGEGAEREAIESSIRDSGMTHNVSMLGRVSNKTRSLLYCSSDVFVMPNIFVQGDMEGFGIVAHEAAMAELPVVASGIEGIKDALVHGKNGILVESRDVDAFTRNILMFQSSKRRNDFGKKARNYTIENFSWDRIAAKYIGIYEELSTKR